MNRSLWRLGLSFLAGAGVTAGAVLLLWRAIAVARPPLQKTSPPPSANGPAPTTGTPDLTPYMSKYVIESPTEQLLALKTLPVVDFEALAFVNPKVEPGKVGWHKTFADACAAAKKSGKPVLLFQMMGKLDERFC